MAIAILLTGSAVFLGADLWLRSPYSEAIVQALGVAEGPDTGSDRLGASQPTPDRQEASTLPPTSQSEAGSDAPNPSDLPPCVPPDDWGLHIVQRGNTLHTMADRYGTGVDTLMRVNCLNTQTIFVGQRLYVPGGVAYPILEIPAEGWPATPDSASADLASALPTLAVPAETPTRSPTQVRTDPPSPLAGLVTTATPERSDSPITPTSPLAVARTSSPNPLPNPTATQAPEATQNSPETPVPTKPATATAMMTPTSSIAAPTATSAPTATLARTSSPDSPTGIPDAPIPVPDGSAASSGGPLASMPNPVEVSTQVPRVLAPAATPTPKSAFQLDIPNRYLNVVLLGSDKRPNSGAWRTDTMIVASLDVETNVVRLLSIPRDLWVYIPGHGYNRINSAELWGELAKKGTGTERVKQTIHHNLGIPIHYYARVDFRGFMEIVDFVGGLDIDVACPLPDIELKPGLHHMDGKQALRFARSRKSTSDYDRGRRQRKVLLALWDQALTTDMIFRLPGLWKSMSHTFETDMPFDQVLNLAYVGVQLEPQHILGTAINRKHVKGWRTPGGASVLLPREEKIRSLLESFYTPKDPDELGVDEVGVQVLNGTSRNQAATLAAYALRWDGFEVVGTGRANTQNQAHTQIIIHSGDASTGEQIARQLEVPFDGIQDLSGIEDKPEVPSEVDIQVILGKDYDPCKR